MPEYLNSPFHTLSDSALSTIARAVRIYSERSDEIGMSISAAQHIELHNFLVDVESELQKRGASGASYKTPGRPTDNSDLLG